MGGTGWGSGTPPNDGTPNEPTGSEGPPGDATPADPTPGGSTALGSDAQGADRWTSGQPVASSDPSSWGVDAQGNLRDPVTGQPVPPPAGPPAADAVPAKAKGSPAWAGWALRIGVIGAIIVAGLIFRDRLSGAATDLRVGDCFEEPAELTEVDEVQHRPCNEAHDAEVIFVGNHPDQETYPGIGLFQQFALDNCIPAFETYVGRDFETDTEYDFGFFYPVSEGWRSGDKEITCYVYRIDETQLTRSVKAAG